jgi:hypothetical protein
MSLGKKIVGGVIQAGKGSQVKLAKELLLCICWYQIAQTPITGNGHASTHIGISTHTGTRPYRYWDLYLEMSHHLPFLLF